jgi:Trk K+ transport system NAD-binding subunit
LKLEIMTATEGSTGTGLTIAEAERRGDGAFHVAEIDGRDGKIPRPPSDIRIAPGDRLLIVARDGGATARTLFTSRVGLKSQ